MYPDLKIINLVIPAYGFFVVVAFALCSCITIQKTRREGLRIENILIFVAATIWGILIGGSVLYIFYSPTELYDYMNGDVFSFTKGGGLVFYGGLAGGIIAGIVSAKKVGLRISILERSIVPYVPMGHAVGKIGCLLTGCCYGVEYSGFLAVKRVLYEEGSTYFPVQLIEVFFNIIIMLVLLVYTKKQRHRYDVLRLYLIMYSAVRFFIEFFRWDGSRESFLLSSISQCISFFIFCSCTAEYIIKCVKKSLKKK